MSCFLGIDLGTSYFKAGIFNEEGVLLGLGRQPVAKEANNETTCELPVPIFWKTVHRCIGDALQSAGITSNEIKAVSYSSQANSFLLLDKFDNPLTSLILWPDHRAKNLSFSLQQWIGKSGFRKKTGLGITPGTHSMLAKIEWYQKKQPQLWSQVKSILSISDYLVFVLSGQKVADCSTSSMTGLFDVTECNWWKEATERCKIHEGQLSNPMKIGSLVGPITDEGAQLTGLSRTTDLYLGGLDHHIVAIGAGLTGFNYISESTGTVLSCVSYQQGYKPRAGVNTAPGLEDNFYFQMAYDGNGAVALEWYQKNYTSGLTIPELLDLAGNIDVGCNGLVAQKSVNTFTGLSGFENREVNHRPAHFVRAILESTGLSLLGLVRKLEETDEVKKIVSSGGGAKSPLWAEIKADILNKTFLTPECNELACQGAAMLGAVGASCFKNMDEAIESQTRFKTVTDPDPGNVEKYRHWRINLMKNK